MGRVLRSSARRHLATIDGVVFDPSGRPTETLWTCALIVRGRHPALTGREPTDGEFNAAMAFLAELAWLSPNTSVNIAAKMAMYDGSNRRKQSAKPSAPKSRRRAAAV